MKACIFLIVFAFLFGIASQAESLNIPKQSVSFDFAEVDKEIMNRNAKRLKDESDSDEILLDRLPSRGISSIETPNLTAASDDE